MVRAWSIRHTARRPQKCIHKQRSGAARGGDQACANRRRLCSGQRAPVSSRCRRGLLFCGLAILVPGLPARAAATSHEGGETVGARLTATLSVAQAGSAGRLVVYTLLVRNGGIGDQADDPASDELVDVLPPQLALRRVDADGGAISVDLASNRVRWNGALAAGAAAVAIRIEADVVVTQPATIRNQARVAYDSDGDGRNDSTALSTDPSQPGQAVPTTFHFAGADARQPRHRQQPSSPLPQR